MEIGVLILLFLMAIGGVFIEHTKVGEKLAYFMTKKFFNIDLNEMED
jgi:hypothetical protein